MAGNTNWNLLHISDIFQKILTYFFSLLKTRIKKLYLSHGNTSLKCFLVFVFFFFFHVKNHRIIEWLTNICLQVDIIVVPTVS